MLPRKVINLHGENRLKNEGNIAASRNKIHTNRNLDFLLKKRFGFVEKNINKDDHILEIGCGAGHAKHYIKNKNFDSNIAHEATTSKISEEQLHYCQQRGLNPEEAVSLIVNGFCKEVLQQLPMEFAVEAQKLVGISLEGSVG